MAIWICRYSHINSNKIRTSPQSGPRIAWIGNPHQQNCMVEVGTWSLLTIVHPEKKNAIKKNSTVRNREFDSLFLTVEFFDLRIFSSGALWLANSRYLPPPYSFAGGGSYRSRQFWGLAGVGSYFIWIYIIISTYSNGHTSVKKLVWTSFYSPFWSSWADLSFAPTFRV